MFHVLFHSSLASIQPRNFKCRLSSGLETCFYPIFNDRAAKGASVANEGQHGRSLRDDQNSGAQIWKIGRLSSMTPDFQRRVPTFPPPGQSPGGRFSTVQENQFSGAHDRVCALPIISSPCHAAAFTGPDATCR